MNEPAWRRRQPRSDRFAEAIACGVTPGDAAEFGAELTVVSVLRQLGGHAVLDAATRQRMRERILAD